MREMALAEYYRLLGHPTDRNARLEAKKSLQVLGHEYDDETLDKTEALIIGDVNAAMAYAYHRIYNHAVDLTYEEGYFYGSYGEQYEQRKKVSETQRKGRYELERIIRFAGRMMKRYPNARVSGGFVVRLAQAPLELENYSDAVGSASKALSLGVSKELRAEALFIKASGEHAERKYEAAKRTLRTLIRDFPNSRHHEHSRRLLAIASEDTGDLEARWTSTSHSDIGSMLHISLMCLCRSSSSSSLSRRERT
jgi:tetratricopeptide (TPR) repeat protein